MHYRSKKLYLGQILTLYLMTPSLLYLQWRGRSVLQAFTNEPVDLPPFYLPLRRSIVGRGAPLPQLRLVVMLCFFSQRYRFIFELVFWAPILLVFIRRDKVEGGQRFLPSPWDGEVGVSHLVWMTRFGIRSFKLFQGLGPCLVTCNHFGLLALVAWLSPPEVIQALKHVWYFVWLPALHHEVIYYMAFG